MDKNFSEKYNMIGDVASFVKIRSDKIFSKHIVEFANLQRFVFFIDFLRNYLPQRYISLGGCLVKDNSFMEPEKPDPCDATRNIGNLIVRQHNQMVSSLSVGCYEGAFNCLRCLIEWEIKTLSAITDLSILSNELRHKNNPCCFSAFCRLMETSDRNRLLTRKKKNEIRRLSKEFANKIEESNDLELRKILSFVSLESVSVRDGIGDYPKKLNPNILKYIKYKHGKKIFSGSEAVYKIYELLSINTHFSLSKFNKIDVDGCVDFYDKKEFMQNYNHIVKVIDAVLYLFIMIIDIDVFHRENKWRANWRQKVDKTFQEAKKEFENSKNRKYLKDFISVNALLSSKEWTSKDATKFNSQPQYPDAIPLSYKPPV